MTRIAQMIYMLSQCKDAIDNPAALFAYEAARMARIERLFARIAQVEKSELWRIFAPALTNQELALAVTSLRAEAENPKQQWRTK